MTKKRHSKDKLYINPKEYAESYGGFKKKSAISYHSLPFNCCGLALTPFKTPVCTDSGIVFEVENIVPFIKKYNRNPVNGEALKVSNLIPLHFHKNSQGQFHCPVTFKVFNDHTHIVANRKSGHVYAYEAIENLCKKPKCWNDLITGQPFLASDLITIQHPHDVAARKIEDFDYIKRGLDVPFKFKETEENIEVPFIEKTDMMNRVLKETKESEAKAIQEHYKLIESSGPPSKLLEADAAEPYEESKKHRIYTTHRQAASFTSTAVDASWKTEYRDKTFRELMQVYYDRVKKQKKKGYVRLVTSKGVVNLELHCDLVPVACDNFLRHCQSGYYEGTFFHRCIANFMIQGGDPTGTGNGGESAFEDKVSFEDEFHPHLVHKGIGVVSMANSGRNTNKSQFFITFKSCEHLNNKHTVFGRVVGGIPVLKEWEKLETTKTDRPKDPPRIESAVVFCNPFDDAKKEMQTEREEAAKKEIQVQKNAGMTWLGPSSVVDAMENHPNRSSDSVGKYMDSNEFATPTHSSTQSAASSSNGTTSTLKKVQVQDEYATVPIKKKFVRTDFDFSKW